MSLEGNHVGATEPLRGSRDTGTNGSLAAGDMGEAGGKNRNRFGVFASCCCCDDTTSEDGTKEHEVVIPKPRGCTDCAYLIIYVMFCCILLLIGVFALVYGNPLRLINGMDSFGNVCGTNNENFANMSFSGLDMSDKPFVFYFNLQDMDSSAKICVKECPPAVIRNMDELVEFHKNTSINLCRYDFNFTEPEEPESSIGTFESQLTDTFCPDFPIYSSLPVLKRCIPSPSEQVLKIPIPFANIYAYLNKLNIFKQILGDLAVTWVSVLTLTSLSFVISLLLIVLLHWMTALISYFIMITTALISVGFTAFMWWTYASIKTTLDNTDRDRMLNEMIRNETAFLTYSILSTIFSVFLVLIVLYLRNRVTVVVKLFREAASALMAMPCLLIQPFLTYLSLTAFFCAWLYIVLCLATADQPKPRRIHGLNLHQNGTDFSFLSGNMVDLSNWSTEESAHAGALQGGDMENFMDQDGAPFAEPLVDDHPHNRTVTLSDISTLTLIEYSDSIWVKYLWWIYILGLIWCSEFILGCQQMVIASSVAAWYFSRNRAHLKCVIMESIVRLIKYHLGSVALGSLLITLVKVPRLVLKFLDRVLRKWDDQRWAQWAIACCVNLICCFEKCMRYVHHNAYTVIAIQGVGFCPAAKLAFSALVQNALQISVINSIGDCVLFMAKCIAAVLTGLVAVIYFQQDETLYFYAVPVLLTVVFAYFVAHCVISVFEMAVDTLFLCFCEDHNMHNGAPDGQQFYAPSTLLRYMTIDAVDAVAAGRRRSYQDAAMNSKIAQISAEDRQSFPEESIPMNPYAPTTERIED